MHDQPVVFWSLVVGFAGPIMVVAVPRVRLAYGWVPPEPIPITYPRMSLTHQCRTASAALFLVMKMSS